MFVLYQYGTNFIYEFWFLHKHKSNKKYFINIYPITFLKVEYKNINEHDKINQYLLSFNVIF